ncbi:NUDIX hydrolase [Verrucomicrobia bacterium LW23]|nr:NUDIX hydrolase [Verrucomicrobia bacterium LW23]
MAEDIFDVVDEQDRVVGQERRSVVHACGLRHRAVHILVFNASGHVFLQKRSASKDLHPLTWDSSSSGHVDSGEDYDTSAVREIAEELGVRAPAAELHRLFYLTACPETGNEFVWVYRWQCEGPFALCPREIVDGAFFPPAEVDAWLAARPGDFAPALRYLWAKVRGSAERDAAS